MGPGIKSGIGKGLAQLGQTAMQTGMFKRRMDQDQSQFDTNAKLKNRELIARYAWLREMGGLPGEATGQAMPIPSAPGIGVNTVGRLQMPGITGTTPPRGMGMPRLNMMGQGGPVAPTPGASDILRRYDEEGYA